MSKPAQKAASVRGRKRQKHNPAKKYASAMRCNTPSSRMPGQRFEKPPYSKIPSAYSRMLRMNLHLSARARPWVAMVLPGEKTRETRTMKTNNGKIRS